MPSISYIEFDVLWPAHVLICFFMSTHLNTSIYLLPEIIMFYVRINASVLLIDCIDHVWKSNFEKRKLLNIINGKPQQKEIRRNLCFPFRFSRRDLGGWATTWRKKRFCANLWIWGFPGGVIHNCRGICVNFACW